jgi:hypothetical protein
MENGLIDQADRADEIGLVVEAPDEMTRPFDRTDRQMIDVVRATVGPQVSY